MSAASTVAGGIDRRVLYPHQLEAVAAATRGLAECGRGQVIMACGTGKTLVALRVAEQLAPAGGLIVFLAPTLSLIAQTLAGWCQDANIPFTALAVCSDDTTTDAPIHLEDLSGGVDVTTDPAAIRAWLSTDATYRVVVGTYVSAARLGEALTAAGMSADLLVCDEAHHLAGRADFVTRKVLHNSHLPALRRLFLTATPRSEIREDRPGPAVMSMSDESLFGPVLYRYSFAQAIAEGRLEDYRVVVVGVTSSEARRHLAATGADYVERIGGIDLRTAVAQAAVVKAVREYGLRRIVSFHPRIADAAEFSRTLPRIVERLPVPARPDLDCYAAHVHGEMTVGVRERILDRLRQPPHNSWVVVSNARVLGEGIDVPAIDAVAFAHAKSSSVDIVQAVGRALRRHADSAGAAVIVVPIIVPDSDGEIGDLDAGEYTTLWRVVRALRAHDETLALELDMQRSHSHTEADLVLPSRITMLLPDGLLDKTLAELSILLVRNTTSQWWEGIGHARDHLAEHGHLMPTTDHRTRSGFPLGRWIAHRRNEYHRGWLAPDRVQLLQEMGMIWDPAEQAWWGRWEDARRYHAEHGHLRVTSSDDQGRWRSLAAWISGQRGKRQDGILTASQIDALDQLGMIWTDPAWTLGYAACVAYHRDHGDLDAPKAYVSADGFALGWWLNSRRVSHAKGDLPADRVEALTGLGMIWSRKQASWDNGYAHACQFHAEHGHLRVPHAYRSPDGFKLGSWVLHQRQLYSGVKKGDLAAEAVQALNRLNIEWQPRRARPAVHREKKDKNQ